MTEQEFADSKFICSWCGEAFSPTVADEVVKLHMEFAHPGSEARTIALKGTEKWDPSMVGRVDQAANRAEARFMARYERLTRKRRASKRKKR